MKNQQLVVRERQLGVSPPFIVGEFHFVRAVQELHDGADLAVIRPDVLEVAALAEIRVFRSRGRGRFIVHGYAAGVDVAALSQV